MRIYKRLMAAALMVFAAQSACAADEGWVDELPVKPGASPESAKTQRIYLNRKSDFRLVDKKAWLSGQGNIAFDDNRSYKFLPGAGDPVEVTFDAPDDAVFAQCRQALQGDIPPGMQIYIAGEGRYARRKKPDEVESEADVACAQKKVTRAEDGDDDDDAPAKSAAPCMRRHIEFRKSDTRTLWVFELFHLSECRLASAVSRPSGEIR